MDLDANLRRYLDGGIGSGGRKPNERYASFGYCFNYFQSFRELGNISALADPANVQLSCVQLGFYLASWGMLRGSAELLQKSARQLVPIIEVVAGTDASLWDLVESLRSAGCTSKVANRLRQSWGRFWQLRGRRIWIWGA